MIDTSLMNFILGEIIDRLNSSRKTKADWAMASNSIRSNLRQFGDYARREYLAENGYTLILLDSYSAFCYYYALIMFHLDQYDEAEDAVLAAAFIRPTHNEDFFIKCDNLHLNIVSLKGMIRTATIHDVIKRRPPSIRNGVQELKGVLDRLP